MIRLYRNNLYLKKMHINGTNVMMTSFGHARNRVKPSTLIYCMQENSDQTFLGLPSKDNNSSKAPQTCSALDILSLVTHLYHLKKKASLAQLSILNLVTVLKNCLGLSHLGS